MVARGNDCRNRNKAGGGCETSANEVLIAGGTEYSQDRARDVQPTVSYSTNGAGVKRMESYDR